MCEKSCGLFFDSPLLRRKNALLFWRKSHVCFSLVAPGVFPHACRCAGADTRSCIAHSASLKFLPSPFTFTDNGLIYSWLWVNEVRFLFLHRWRKLRWSLHPQIVVHQLIILYGWRGEGKKTKNAVRARIRVRVKDRRWCCWNLSWGLLQESKFW